MTTVDEITEKTVDEKFIDELVNDHSKFDDYVYFSSMEEAMAELERRRNDKELQKKVEEYFKDVGIPEHFQGDISVAMCRAVVTPNIETSRFLIIADGVDLKPVFLEYHSDQFSTHNAWKKSIGRLGFYEGIGKRGGLIISYQEIINFFLSYKKSIKEINTLWGENLIEFHHRLFFENYSHIPKKTIFDASEWLYKNGYSAKEYYAKLLGLFITNAILLENFVPNGNELDFTKNIFLPAFNKVTKSFGVKPVIVSLSPTNIETEDFWFCQNSKTKNNIREIIDKYKLC